MPTNKNEATTYEFQKKILRLIKSRSRGVGPAAAFGEQELLSWNCADTGAGPGEPKEVAPPEFYERESIEARSFDVLPWEEFPNWLLKQTDCRLEQSRDALFDQMLENLRKEPSRRNFLLALIVLNEIGRFADGGEYITKRISQRLLDEFQPKESMS